MKELVDDIFYKTLQKKYPKLLLDYVLLEPDEPYQEASSHQNAVAAAISVFNSRVRVGNSLAHPRFFVEHDKMRCITLSIKDLFYEGSDAQVTASETTPWTAPARSYYTAFSQPPYPIPYTKEDFRKINHLLFPVAYRNDLAIYRWNDDFSNYFDDGKEWWGTMLLSIYDKWMGRFVIIGASLTD